MRKLSVVVTAAISVFTFPASAQLGTNTPPNDDATLKMQRETEATIPSGNPSGIFDIAVLLSLTLHVVGNSAKGDLGAVEVDADKEMLRLNKQLLDCPEYEALRDAAAKIRDMVKRKCFGGESKVFTGMDGRVRLQALAGRVSLLLADGVAPDLGFQNCRHTPGNRLCRAFRV